VEGGGKPNFPQNYLGKGGFLPWNLGGEGGSLWALKNHRENGKKDVDKILGFWKTHLPPRGKKSSKEKQLFK